MLYVVPSTVSASPSLVHVTVVAGEPVEVQVRVREAASNSRSLMVGAAGEEGGVYSICSRIPDIAFHYINHLIRTSVSPSMH